MPKIINGQESTRFVYQTSVLPRVFKTQQKQ